MAPRGASTGPGVFSWRGATANFRTHVTSVPATSRRHAAADLEPLGVLRQPSVPDDASAQDPRDHQERRCHRGTDVRLRAITSPYLRIHRPQVRTAGLPPAAPWRLSPHPRVFGPCRNSDHTRLSCAGQPALAPNESAASGCPRRYAPASCNPTGDPS